MARLLSPISLLVNVHRCMRFGAAARSFTHLCTTYTEPYRDVKIPSHCILHIYSDDTMYKSRSSRTDCIQHLGDRALSKLGSELRIAHYIYTKVSTTIL